MTIATTNSEIEYSTNGTTTEFATGFYFLLDSDIVVTFTTSLGVEVSLGLNVDYTVLGAGDLNGGSVRCTTAPATGGTLLIARVVPVTQIIDYIQDDAFPAESHEKALDKLTMICQQLQSNIDNAVLASTTEGEANTASNLGSGLGLYKQKSVLDLQFRSISSPSNGTVGMAIVSDRIEIDVLTVVGQENFWSDRQYNEYNIPTVATGQDHAGWVALVHNNVGSTNKDNIVALIGHAYHDGNWDNNTGAMWGIATEAWSNSLGKSTLVGGELSVIQQYASSSYPSVGLNVTFKNRLDIDTHPTAAVGDGSYYNQLSCGVLISSQARPSGTGAAWAGVGSGWNVAIRIGDPGYGSGLDWEGGSSGTTGSPGTIRNFSTIMDFTNASKDLAGGWPWIWLWRTGLTYFGLRFVDTISTGEIEIAKSTPAAGGAGYAVNDVGTIDNGTGGTYKVTAVSAGVVTAFDIVNPGTQYYVNANNGTTATTGGGTGFQIDIQQIVGERIELWRMTDPGDPAGSGFRYGFMDFAYSPIANRGGAFLKSFE